MLVLVSTGHPIGHFCPHIRGGTHALFCDGSVRFLGNSLDMLTLKRAATRDDGNPLGEF
jgi:prepilin-type processing-associated H-X9-DG protein